MAVCRRRLLQRLGAHHGLNASLWRRAPKPGNRSKCSRSPSTTLRMARAGSIPALVRGDLAGAAGKVLETGETTSNLVAIGIVRQHRQVSRTSLLPDAFLMASVGAWAARLQGPRGM